MMKAKLSVGVAVLCLVAMGVRAEEENPLKKAKVGDWIQYASKTEMAGTKQESEMKQTVTAKTDTELTMEIVMKVNGQEMKNSSKIDLTKKYDPLHAQPNAKVKELGKGEEKLTVGGKTLDTKWTEVEVTANMGGRDMVTKSKVWVAPDSVPLGGMVKMESDLAGMGKMVMEMKDFGSGK